jgi:hypothetical protein
VFAVGQGGCLTTSAGAICVNGEARRPVVHPRPSLRFDEMAGLRPRASGGNVTVIVAGARPRKRRLGRDLPRGRAGHGFDQ